MIGPIERQRARLGRDHDVLETHAESPGQIDPRFDRPGVTELDGAPVSRHDVRVLVLLDPDPVTGPVDEELAEPGIVDDASTRRVDG